MTQYNELIILDISSDGRGVTRLPSGMVVMIPDCLPGDTVSAEIEVESGDKPKYQIVSSQITKPSPDRVAHSCEHLAEGCQGSILGALDYEAGLKLKHKRLVESLRRIGKLEDLEVKPVILVSTRWQYRDRIELKMIPNGDAWSVSFSGSRGDVAIRTCQIAKESINRVLSQIDSHPVTDSDTYPQNRLLLRDNGRGQAVGVVYVTSKLELTTLAQMTEWLDVLDLNGWQIRETKSIADRFFNSKLAGSAGNPNIYVKTGDKELITSPAVFTQTNSDMAGTLLSTVLKPIPVSCRLLDLYGGYGSFAIAHALRGGQSTVVESMSDSISSGRIFCRQNALNVKYITSNLSRKADWMKWRIKYGACIVDPPRAGLSNTILNWIQARGADKLIYVSCHPAALARDLKQLTKYKIIEIQPIDMFPQTTELETVVVLGRG